MWDLRFATSPVKVFDKHKRYLLSVVKTVSVVVSFIDPKHVRCCLFCFRGILSVAWCPQDSDLLLTAAKDNRVLCWNPNSAEPGGEMSTKCHTVVSR